jgi:hypothetical protein
VRISKLAQFHFSSDVCCNSQKWNLESRGQHSAASCQFVHKFLNTNRWVSHGTAMPIRTQRQRNMINLVSVTTALVTGVTTFELARSTYHFNTKVLQTRHADMRTQQQPHCHGQTVQQPAGSAAERHLIIGRGYTDCRNVMLYQLQLPLKIRTEQKAHQSLLTLGRRQASGLLHRVTERVDTQGFVASCCFHLQTSNIPSPSILLALLDP